MATELLTDDGELQLQVVHDFWRRHVAGGTLSPALAAHLARRGDTPTRWARLLARHVARPLSRSRWPDALPAAADDTAWHATFAEVRALWAASHARIVAIVGDALPRLNGTVYKPASLAAASASWQRLLAVDDADAADFTLAKLDLLTATRLTPKKGQAPLEPHPFFERAAALLALHGQRLAALEGQRLALLRRLLDEGPAALRALKRERRVVAFDDLLQDLHQRLTAAGGDALAAALRTRWPVALIDEFQDTDPLQWAIFQALHGRAGAPLFLLGDPKQAIYSFRHADLHTYLRARAQAGACRALADNQRSAPALLAGLNALFGAHATGFVLPGLHYPAVTAGAKPRPAFDDRSAPRAPLQLWALPRDADGQPIDKPTALTAAARAVAADIARLLGAARRGEVQLDGRALSAGDIAVLVRTHAHGARMRQALAEQGVGCIELSRADVHRSVDAEELERVLAAMLAPTRDATLRAALATELMGLDAAAIDALARDEGALLAHGARFASYRSLWLQRGVGPMLRRWLQQEGVAPRLLRRDDGERRLTNLMHLAERLHEAAVEHPAPEAQLRWLQRQRREGGGGDAAQLRLESDRDLVSIVTIHKSKGLEYPLVYCPFLWDGDLGRADDLSDGVETRDDDGHPVIDFRPDAGTDTVKARQHLERMAEQVRLIYVALTRAVHRCVLVVGPYRSHRSTRQAGTAPLNWLLAGGGRDPATLARQPLAPEDIESAWRALAAAQAPHVDLQPLPRSRAQPLAPPAAAPQALAAWPAPPPRPTSWWLGSFSGLVRGLRHDAAAQDHDDLLPAAAADAEVADDDDDILGFARGPEAGECLHALFERADFTQPAGWPAAAAQALRLHPPAAAGDAPRAARQLLRLLHDVVHTPLLPGLRLADVAPAQRLVEWEFTLPVARLTAAGLAAVLARHGLALALPGFAPLSGYLRGFVDLAFCHQGRWYVVDWKSNHLGGTPADYAGAALARAIDAHGYGLQALLYALALHRHLQRRLPGYDAGRDFGGALMLFVRGLRPGWVDGQGRPCGLWQLQPGAALLDDLSALLDSTAEVT
jgi:exodeoxyribonuclease V beta subunit